MTDKQKAILTKYLNDSNMKKDKKQKDIVSKKKREYNAGKIFGRIMALMLIVFMLAGTFATLIFALQ